MIRFEDVGKAYRDRKGEVVWIIRHFSASLAKGTRTAILGRPGSGKTTLIDLASGNETTSEGDIFRTSKVSWPYGSRGQLSNKLTGRQNLRFLSDVYGRHFADLVDFVADFAELNNRAMDQDLRQWNNEMRNRFSVSALFGMRFDLVVIDDDVDFGDQSFRRRAMQYLDDNADDLSILLATSNVQLANRLCTTAGVLRGGEIHMFDRKQDAIADFSAASRNVA